MSRFTRFQKSRSKLHSLAPAAEVAPGWHGAHVDDPLLAEKVSTGHGIHIADPTVEAKLPGGHCTHEDAPPGDIDPSGQLVQIDDPATEVYVPSVQGKHVLK
jgi:hypothetical protein